ncbi:MAG: hypothetical protein ACR2MU_06415 [Gaiellaceae bacterium]
MRTLLLLIALALAACSSAAASTSVQFGLQDDAWLAYGEGSVQERVAALQTSGVGIVRYTVRWDQVEATRGTPDWTVPDRVLNALHDARLPALVTLYGTPRWANGGSGANVAPTSGSTFAAFARATAERYPWVRDYLIWNEPNKTQFLRPSSPTTYVRRLLNPAYATLHAAMPGAKVGGGATGPRAGSGNGLSPIAFMRGMAAAHARLDAYAHHPYPSSRFETPTSGGSRYCDTITMATLPRLLAEVKRDFGASKRIWLTEYGYQTYPDRTVGVSFSQQAQYIGQAALRTFDAPRVDILIHFLYRDDIGLGGWQSGLETLTGARKPGYNAYRLPIAQRSRIGLRTVLWGQVRARSGRQPFHLQQQRSGRWYAVGGTRVTAASGTYGVTVRASAGARFRIWSPRDHTYSPIVTVR